MRLPIEWSGEKLIDSHAQLPATLCTYVENERQTRSPGAKAQILDAMHLKKCRQVLDDVENLNAIRFQRESKQRSTRAAEEECTTHAKGATGELVNKNKNADAESDRQAVWQQQRVNERSYCKQAEKYKKKIDNPQALPKQPKPGTLNHHNTGK